MNGVIMNNVKSQVINFITEFKSATRLFMEGKCYWFAIILRERFVGELYYDPVWNHWACLINDVLYDVTGVVKEGAFSPWPGIFVEDTPHYQRLIDQCIEFNK